MRNRILILFFSAVGIAVAGCAGGGGGGGGDRQQDITVTLSPKTVSVAGGQTQVFTATILNPNNNGVSWSLSGSGCTGSACGTLGNYSGNNNQGWTATYTAPLTAPNPATVTISARSVDDTSKSDTATATITAAAVTVAVSPKTANVILGATQQFTATVRGNADTAATWNVSGPGAVNSSGLYTAPATLTTPASATVTAKSHADNTKSDSTTVTIPAVTVSITPQTATVILGASQQFTATVGNATNTAVTWTVAGTGTVSNAGLYTAPSMQGTPATASVTATSVADPTKSVTVSIQIPAVSVTISPKPATVILGATRQFTAAITNATNQTVTWTLSGPGSVSSSGLYTAPATLTTPATATLTATSVNDPSKSDSVTITIPAVGVSVSPPTSTLGGGQTQQFTATVTNATNTAVTWTIAGLGSISTQGLYSAPAIVPGESTVTVTATSVADATKSGSATIELMPISVSVLPGNVMVAITGKKQFTAGVIHTSNTAVTWSVSGSGCSGGTCGTIDTSGRYVAPSAVPSPSTVTVKATSVADPTRFGTASVQIMPNGNFKLNGNYALYFQGGAQGMLSIVGSVHADGNGNLDGGVYDENGPSITDHAPHAISNGTYTVGLDNRGVFTWSGHTFRFAISDTGDRGFFINFDTSGLRGSGVFKKQTTSDFSSAKVSGDYAFGVSGEVNWGPRNALVGRFTANGTGGLAQGALDSVSAVLGHTRVDSFTGTVVMDASTGGPGYGRGTMLWTIPGAVSFHAAFYMVSADELFFLTLDPATQTVPVLGGTILRQSPPPFKVTDLSGPAVLHATGVDDGCHTIMLGQWVASPNSNTGNGTVSAEYASNDCGSTLPLGNFTGLFSIAINGRANLISNTGGIPSFYYYMIGPNKAFLVSDDAYVMTGMFEPQTIPQSGFTNASIAGDYFLGTIDRQSAQVIDASGVANFDGVSTWTSMEDGAFPEDYNVADVAGTEAYTITSPQTGRGTFTYAGSEVIVFYAVSPSKIYNFVLYTPDRIAQSEQQTY